MKLARPFIRLPFNFDVEQLQQEVAQFSEERWMAHPSRLTGNSALPLVSVNGQDNDDFSGPMEETPHLQKCPYVRQIMSEFNEVIARSRFMRLAGKSEVSPHVDFNYHWYSRIRIHIPVITNPEVIFHCGDEAIHMAAGECWIFDSWRLHQVVNNSEQTRIHLVIDTAGSGEFWRRVRTLEALRNDEVVPDLVEFQPSNAVDIKTERYNVSPVMAPGELEALIIELLEDLKANPDNDAELLELYHSILTSLAKDWRALWLHQGWEAQALVEYKALLEQTAAKLHPKPRALVTASNNVGANPIIMQRILRAALFADQRHRFVH